VPQHLAAEVRVLGAAQVLEHVSKVWEEPSKALAVALREHPCEVGRDIPAPLAVVQHQRHDERQRKGVVALAQPVLPDADHVAQQAVGEHRVGRALVLEEQVQVELARALEARTEEDVGMEGLEVGVDEGARLHLQRLPAHQRDDLCGQLLPDVRCRALGLREHVAKQVVVPLLTAHRHVLSRRP
jgi:hypothetical protein